MLKQEEGKEAITPTEVRALPR